MICFSFALFNLITIQIIATADFITKEKAASGKTAKGKGIYLFLL